MSDLLSRLRLWFNKTGFDIVRINTIIQKNINNKLFNPGIERVKSSIVSEVFDLPINKGRSLPVHSFNKNGYHPFVNAAKKALMAPKKKRYVLIKKYLREYYSQFSPITAGHLMNCTKTSKLYKFPPWAVIMPWQSESSGWLVAAKRGACPPGDRQAGLAACRQSMVLGSWPVSHAAWSLFFY